MRRSKLLHTIHPDLVLRDRKGQGPSASSHKGYRVCARVAQSDPKVASYRLDKIALLTSISNNGVHAS